MEQIVNTNQKIISQGKASEAGVERKFKFNPFLPEFHAHPYPTYQRLQLEDPVHLSSIGAWVMTRYCDVVKALRDPRLSSKQSQISSYSSYQQSNSPVVSLSSQLLFFRDPPDHTRLRKLVTKAFNVRVIEEMRPHIQQIVDELINKVKDTGAMDIIADLSRPLPVRGIAQMLGIPLADSDQLQQWSDCLSYILDPIKSSNTRQQLNQSILEFRDYLRNLVQQRRQNPENDLISALIQARDERDMLSEDELLVTCILLFATGEETTVNLIGNGMLTLLSHQDQLEKLKQNPSLIQSAVEEILRYESPVQISGRTVLDNLEIGGKVIRKGSPVFLILGAANRDSAHFCNPNQFNITRCENNHLAFGDGIHYCLGAALARIQGQIAINTLIQRLPNMKLQVDQPKWRENIFLRGLTTLPVTFSNYGTSQG